MSSESSPLLSCALAKGTYSPASPTDKRSPCPLINSLANHGYISRDGRNIPAHELNAAMNVVGLSTALGSVFSNAIYNIHQDPRPAHMSTLSRLWSFLRNPWTLLAVFGMRRMGQEHKGKPVVDLDQLALHGVVEHDVSLTRRDAAQRQGNCVSQPDLVAELLACPVQNGGVSMEAFAELRKRRIQQQLNDNPELKYGAKEHQIACGEIALILSCFGDGKSVKWNYLKAVFEDERLPFDDGWKKRRWWTVGFRELASGVAKLKVMIGLQV
jgi:hypothetical protein